MCRASSRAYRSAPPSTPLDPNNAGTMCSTRGLPLSCMRRARFLGCGGTLVHFEHSGPVDGPLGCVGDLAATEHVDRQHLERDGVIDDVHVVVLVTEKEVDGIRSFEQRQVA